MKLLNIIFQNEITFLKNIIRKDISIEKKLRKQKIKKLIEYKFKRKEFLAELLEEYFMYEYEKYNQILKENNSLTIIL